MALVLRMQSLTCRCAFYLQTLALNISLFSLLYLAQNHLSSQRLAAAQVHAQNQLRFTNGIPPRMVPPGPGAPGPSQPPQPGHPGHPTQQSLHSLLPGQPHPVPNGIGPGPAPQVMQGAPLGFPMSNPPPGSQHPQPNGIGHGGSGGPHTQMSTDAPPNSQGSQQAGQSQGSVNTNRPSPQSGGTGGGGARPPFQSPTLVNAQHPGNPAGAPGSGAAPGYPLPTMGMPGMPPQGFAHAPPHMRAAMYPPSNGAGTPGGVPGGPIGGNANVNGTANNASSPSYQSGSRAATPAQSQQGQGGAIAPSPSLTHRTVQQAGTPPHFGGGGPPTFGMGVPLGMIGNMTGMAGLGMQQQPGLQNIDPQAMAQLKNEVGIDPNKDWNSCTQDERVRSKFLFLL